MKYLLDTHIFLWSLFEPSKLKRVQRETISDPDNDIFLSAVSFWEISLKYSLKKLFIKGVRPEKLPVYAKKAGFEVTSLDENLLISFYKLPNIDHKDPFDRMIIWEAINKKYTMISSDESFEKYKKFGLKIM